MKRLMTSTCLAAAFAVGLAAQSTTAGTSGQDPQGQGRGGPRPVTATGCLRAGDTAGSYMLTDVQMQGGGGRRGGDTTGTTAGGGTTAGTTGGTTAGSTAGGTTAGGGQGRGNMPTTLMLSPASDVDLKPHVGHKIEVTGTMVGRGGQGAGTTGGTTAGGGGTTGGTTSGTTGGTATGTSTSGGGTQGGGRGGRNVTVTSVRMISESCS